MINLEEFRNEMYQSIPLTQAMGLQYQDFNFTRGQLICCLPISPNLNDKTTAFGGSIAALATFSGWSLATLLCRHNNWATEIVVAKSELEFLKPIDKDFYSISHIDQQTQQAFIDGMMEKGKAKLDIEVQIKQDLEGQAAACYRGRYYARLA